MFREYLNFGFRYGFWHNFCHLFYLFVLWKVDFGNEEKFWCFWKFWAVVKMISFVLRLHQFWKKFTLSNIFKCWKRAVYIFTAVLQTIGVPWGKDELLQNSGYFSLKNGVVIQVILSPLGILDELRGKEKRTLSFYKGEGHFKVEIHWKPM